jgi:ERCC4-type nuclease
MLKLILDVREAKIIEKFLLTKEKEKIDYEIRQLPLGDFIFEQDSNSKLMIERKTWKDFAASIVDGRYREQKLRYCGQSCQTIYIIEGKRSEYKEVHRIKADTIESCILSLLIRDRIPIIQTKNLCDTVHWLQKIYFKLIKLEKEEKKDISMLYLSSMHSNKKDNLTPELCFQNQLRQIPGVSTKIATIISKEYPNFPILIRRYQELNEKERPKMLQNINTGKRRLGKKLSEKIYKFIYSTT